MILDPSVISSTFSILSPELITLTHMKFIMFLVDIQIMEISIIAYKMLIWIFQDVLLIMLPLSKVVLYILRFAIVLIDFHYSLFIYLHYLLKQFFWTFLLHFWRLYMKFILVIEFYDSVILYKQLFLVSWRSLNLLIYSI